MTGRSVATDVEAIRTVLDKLTAVQGAPVEFTDAFALRTHGVTLEPLTSEEVAAARRALKELKADA